MKKKSISKLKLKKDSVSNLNANSIIGGTWQSVYLCESVNWCETRDYTRCYGNTNCGIFDTSGDL